mmetsp:Transcript_12649/g.33639  ORF Transcript_12649/g.33639 Transcript_12649/m.33639 type:complete len:230 (-) Transcript_12649:61-750(-)
MDTPRARNAFAFLGLVSLPERPAPAGDLRCRIVADAATVLCGPFLMSSSSSSSSHEPFLPVTTARKNVVRSPASKPRGHHSSSSSPAPGTCTSICEHVRVREKYHSAADGSSTSNRHRRRGIRYRLDCVEAMTKTNSQEKCNVWWINQHAHAWWKLRGGDTISHMMTTRMLASNVRMHHALECRVIANLFGNLRRQIRKSARRDVHAVAVVVLLLLLLHFFLIVIIRRS